MLCVTARMERRIANVRTERLDRTKEAIAQRLRHVCAQLSEDEFDQLVEKIALVEIKYSLRSEKWLDK